VTFVTLYVKSFSSVTQLEFWARNKFARRPWAPRTFL